MIIPFCKYQGAGNDFVMIDENSHNYQLSEKQIQLLCDRHFGIGADGLILLQPDTLSDFKMVYYNSDGKESTMCGNGGRCIVAFARDLNLIKDQTEFIAIDGKHKASISGNKVNLEMQNVEHIERGEDFWVLNTGSPHYVRFVPDVTLGNFVEEARAIRNSVPFREEGINVNFVQILAPNNLVIRTYERGVEDETLACGTGVVAASLAYADKNKGETVQTYVVAKGGNLEVSAEVHEKKYKNIHLIGKAEKVFTGEIEI